MPNQAYNKSLLLGFLMVIAALVVNTGLTFFNLQRLRKNADAVEHQHHVLAELRMLLKILVDAETGQRGFLITEDPKFLAPYESATIALQDKRAAVEKLMSVDPDRRQAFGELNEAIEARINYVKGSLETQRTEGREAVRDLIRQGEGKQAMDKVRDLIAKIETKENAVLKARHAESRVSFVTALTTGLISGLLGLALAVASYWLVARDIEKRQQLSEALQKS